MQRVSTNAHGTHVPQKWKIPSAFFSCRTWMFVANTNRNHIEFGGKMFLKAQPQGKKGKKFPPSFISPVPIAFLDCSPSSPGQELCHSLKKDKRTRSLLPHVHRRMCQPPPSAFHCHQMLQYRSRRGKGVQGPGCASQGRWQQP